MLMVQSILNIHVNEAATSELKHYLISTSCAILHFYQLNKLGSAYIIGTEHPIATLGGCLFQHNNTYITLILQTTSFFLKLQGDCIYGATVWNIQRDTRNFGNHLLHRYVFDVTRCILWM